MTKCHTILIGVSLIANLKMIADGHFMVTTIENESPRLGYMGTARSIVRPTGSQTTGGLWYIIATTRLIKHHQTTS